MKVIQSSAKSCGVGLCDRQLTLQDAVAVVRQFPLFASILGNGNGKRYAQLKTKDQRKEGFAFRAYIPALNGEALCANPIKPPQTIPIKKVIKRSCIENTKLKGWI